MEKVGSDFIQRKEEGDQGRHEARIIPIGLKKGAGRYSWFHNRKEKVHRKNWGRRISLQRELIVGGKTRKSSFPLGSGEKREGGKES